MQGNWHNAIHITCDQGCADCAGFLLAVDREARPVLIAIESLRQALGASVDTSDCAGSFSRQAFELLYASWLLWEIDDSRSCSLRQLLAKNG